MGADFTRLVIKEQEAEKVLKYTAVYCTSQPAGNTFNFSQCCAQMARFKGTQKGEFLDNKHFTGHAFDIFEECMLFMQRHIPLWGKITDDSPFRKENYLIPIGGRTLFESALNL